MSEAILAVGMALMLVNSIVLVLMEIERRKIRGALEAFEEAFACNLIGDEPHIDVMDYPMGNKMWMVPCRDLKKETTDQE